MLKSDKKSLLEIRTRALCDAQKRNACLRYVFYSSFTFRRESGCHNNALAAFLSRFSTFVCCLSAVARVQVRERNSLARSLVAALRCSFLNCAEPPLSDRFSSCTNTNTQCFGMLFAAKMHVPLRAAHSGKKRGVFSL